MLEVMWYLLMIIAIMLILVIADFEYNGYPYYWVLMLTILDTIIWFLLAASVFETEQVYTMYNVSSGNIESGVSIVTSKVSPAMSNFCLMLAMSMFVLSAYIALSAFKTLYKNDDNLQGKPR